MGKPLYRFDGFEVNPERRILLKGGRAVALEGKVVDTLLALLENRGETLSREELLARIWPGTNVEEGVLTRNISVLRKALGEKAGAQEFIVTVKGQGYRFVAIVEEVREEVGEAGGGPVVPTVVPTVVPGPSRPFGGHYAHAVAAAGGYAGLFAVALLVEIAYEFDRYGGKGTEEALWAAGWIFITSVAALWVDTKVTLSGRAGGMAISIGVFLLAALVLQFAVTLPPVPVTRATLQTHTAQAAYLKVSFYFLALALFFMIIPFHLVLALQHEARQGRQQRVAALLMKGQGVSAPKGAIYLRPWMLTVILTGCLVIVGIGSPHLIDNLVMTPHMNRFMILYLLRLLLFFAVGLLCIAWYARALAELKNGA